ncbi:MAG: hypothetical protein R2793_03080 [Flavobacteriaceae bacterium]
MREPTSLMSIMDGATLNAGAVAGVTHIKNSTSLRGHGT